MRGVAKPISYDEVMKELNVHLASAPHTVSRRDVMRLVECFANRSLRERRRETVASVFAVIGL